MIRLIKLLLRFQKIIIRNLYNFQECDDFWNKCDLVHIFRVGTKPKTFEFAERRRSSEILCHSSGPQTRLRTLNVLWRIAWVALSGLIFRHAWYTHTVALEHSNIYQF